MKPVPWKTKNEGKAPPPGEEQQFLRWSWAVAAIAFLLFTIGVWNQPFVGFETRFALFAKEMLRHGVSFFPTTYGKPYPDYPVTSTLAIYFFAKTFGFLNKFIAILPTALASAGVVAVTFLLLVRSSLQWAIATICFELMTFTYLMESRSISLDQMVSLITLTSFYVAYRSETTLLKWEYFWLISLFIAGFLVRGPIGTILPAAAIGSYFGVTKNFRKALIFGLIAFAIILIMWLAQLGLAWHQEGRGFVNEVIRMQVTERMNLEDSQPFYYYFTSSFGGFAPTFPLFILVSLTFLFYRKSLTGSVGYVLMLGLIGWVVVVMLGLSIPHTKKIRYLLPIIPPLCAVASYPFAVEVLPRLKGFLKSFFFIFPFLLIVVLLYGETLVAHKGIDVSQQVLWALLALTLLQLVSAMSFLLSSLRLYQTGLICVSAAFASWFSIVLVVEPTLNKLHDTSMFVAQAEWVRSQHVAPLAFYKIAKDAMAIKYMVHLDRDELPYFTATEEGLKDLPKPIYILMEKSAKDKLSLEVSSKIQVLVSGKFDDKTNLNLVFWPARNSDGMSPVELHLSDRLIKGGEFRNEVPPWND